MPRAAQTQYDENAVESLHGEELGDEVAEDEGTTAEGHEGLEGGLGEGEGGGGRWRLPPDRAPSSSLLAYTAASKLPGVRRRAGCVFGGC